MDAQLLPAREAVVAGPVVDDDGGDVILDWTPQKRAHTRAHTRNNKRVMTVPTSSRHDDAICPPENRVVVVVKRPTTASNVQRSTSPKRPTNV